MPNDKNALNARDWLTRIGLDDDAPNDLLSDDDPLPNLSGDPAAALRERFHTWRERTVFNPGDLVTWKTGLQNRRYPRVGQPAVVLEVLDPPVFDQDLDSGSPYFHEPLDLVLGLFVDEGSHRGEFLNWHFDSRRFQHWTSD